jgi:hypothetical protein
MWRETKRELVHAHGRERDMRCVDCDLWFVVCDVWIVICGVWFVMCGVRCEV